jgi:hypothetical protein
VTEGGVTALSDGPTSNPMRRDPENKSGEIRAASTVKNATEGFHLYSHVGEGTVSGDFSFVNAHLVLTVIGFHCNGFDTWCDEIVSWEK